MGADRPPSMTGTIFHIIDAPHPHDLVRLRAATNQVGDFPAPADLTVVSVFILGKPRLS